jgi:hypothetical protein
MVVEVPCAYPGCTNTAVRLGPGPNLQACRDHSVTELRDAGMLICQCEPPGPLTNLGTCAICGMLVDTRGGP